MSTRPIFKREPPLLVVRFSDFDATRAWIFQSRAKVLRALRGMYMLVAGLGLGRSKEARELAEVVGPDEDLLLFCSERGLVRVSSSGLVL